MSVSGLRVSMIEVIVRDVRLRVWRFGDRIKIV
jgi:hypothetical protein